MAKASLDQSDYRRPHEAQAGGMSRLDRTRLAIADKIDELTLDTAASRSRRGAGISPQLDILMTNHERRRAILARAAQVRSRS